MFGNAKYCLCHVNFSILIINFWLEQVLSVFHDAFGTECRKLLEDATSEKKIPPPTPAPAPLQHQPPPPPQSTSYADDPFSSSYRMPEAEYSGSTSDLQYSNHGHTRKAYDEDSWDKYDYRYESSGNNNRDQVDDYARSSDRHYRYDKQDSRKWDKEKKHHHYHHKSDKERDRRDHHRRDRDYDYDYDYDKKDRDRDRGRDSKYRDSKYRDSYKKSSDRDHKSSTDGYSGFSHPVQPPLPPHHAASYDSKTYESGFQPPLPPQPAATSSAYPAPPAHPPYAFGSVPTTPSAWHHSQPAWPETPAVPQPPETDEPKPPKPSEPKKKDKKDKDTPKGEKKTTAEEIDQSTIDLDTRIAMMFKEKSFGAAPSFLQLDDSDSDTEKEHKDQVKTEPVDMDTSESCDGDANAVGTDNTEAQHKIILDAIKKEPKGCIEDGASDISSDDDLLLKSPLRSVKNEDDKMSLSSLSSNEDKVHRPAVASAGGDGTALPADYIYPPGTDPYYYANGAQYTYDTQYMPSTGYIQPYMSDFSTLIPGSYMQSEYKSPHKGTKSSDTNSKYDPCEEIISDALDQVTDELKQILKRDFNKKMIENTAYKTFETWWDEQAKSDTVDVEKDTSISKAPDINETLSKTHVIDSFEKSNGFGLRSQIVKLPRFQRLRKLPSPVHQDEDSMKGLSDQEEMVQGSESESEDNEAKPTLAPNRVSIDKVPKEAAKAPSESSFFTSSSDDESSSESDSDSESSSLSDIDELPKITNKTRDRKIYSDSDSEEEVTKAKPLQVNKTKLRLCSDTLSEDEAPKKPKSPKPETNAKKRSPEPASDGVRDASQSPKLPRTPGRESPPKKPAASYDYARIYSDSEEEREYQEKRRRNTEYMEQIEREILEEQMLQKQQKPTKTDADTTEDDEPMPEKAPSPGDPITPLTTKPPPTPGAKLQFDPLSKLSETKTPNTISRKKKNDSNGVGFTSPIDSAMSGTDDDIRAVKLSPASSDGGSSQESQTSQASQVAMDHCYSLPPSKSPASQSPHPGDALAVAAASGHPPKSDILAHDHGYTNNATVSATAAVKREEVTATVSGKAGRPKKESAARKNKKAKATAVSDEPKQELAPFVPEQRYEERSAQEKMMVMYEFLTKGIDAEDIEYLRRSYEYLLQDDKNSYWLNATHWKEHCVTDRSMLPPPNKKRKKDDELRKHATGCARAEGYYKIDIRDKMRFKYHQGRTQDMDEAEMNEIQAKAVSKMQLASREARSNQRRLLTAFGASTESELLKFNQLKFRKKQLKFAKSGIHDWGLFAMEPIAADEMVIEYVGQMIRPSVADSREARYEAIGIGSSYLFRIDVETIIDATKCGNLARFINHSCNVSILCVFILRSFLTILSISIHL